MPEQEDSTVPLLNLDQWEEAARRALPSEVYDYYAGGADDELTLRLNRAAFGRYLFSPRRLVDVSELRTSTDLFGQELATPILIAPTAFQKLAHPDGELATARAAADLGTVMVASTVSTYPIEDIADAAGGSVWLQLYVFRDREITKSLVERAEAAGCRAICMTVDVPHQGNRERDVRNSFRLPDGMEIANFVGLRQARFPDKDGSGLAAFIHREFDPSLTWEAVGWLRAQTSLPILLKGILSSEDGREALRAGADGIIVSNHGGRQLDGAKPTLLALPRVIDAVEDEIPVLLDGGVRRGSDIVKALALGARAVLVGRPVLWGLAVDGRQGADAVLKLLHEELLRTMALLGRPTLESLDASALIANPFSSVDSVPPGVSVR